MNIRAASHHQGCFCKNLLKQHAIHSIGYLPFYLVSLNLTDLHALRIKDIPTYLKEWPPLNLQLSSLKFNIRQGLSHTRSWFQKPWKPLLPYVNPKPLPNEPFHPITTQQSSSYPPLPTPQHPTPTPKSTNPPILSQQNHLIPWSSPNRLRILAWFFACKIVWIWWLGFLFLFGVCFEGEVRVRRLRLSMVVGG